MRYSNEKIGMKRAGLSTIVMMPLILSTVHAATWYVHPDSALNTIQAGLDSCSAGDTVLVAAGIYFDNLRCYISYLNIYIS